MATRLPKPRKPPETLRRRNAPEQWTSLPAAGCSLVAPKWPFGKPSKAEADLWARLWALPVAVYWHEQRIEPTIVATYARLATTKPEHASSLKLMGRSRPPTPTSTYEWPDERFHVLHLGDAAQKGLMESENVRGRILRIDVYPGLDDDEESAFLLSVEGNATVLFIDRLVDFVGGRVRRGVDASL